MSKIRDNELPVCVHYGTSLSVARYGTIHFSLSHFITTICVRVSVNSPSKDKSSFFAALLLEAVLEISPFVIWAICLNRLAELENRQLLATLSKDFFFSTPLRNKQTETAQLCLWAQLPNAASVVLPKCSGICLHLVTTSRSSQWDRLVFFFWPFEFEENPPKNQKI